MTKLILSLVGCIVPLLAIAAAAPDAGPRLAAFSPQGTVKAVRQVTARFSEPMVSFGDPRAPQPFDVECPVGGTGRWIDVRNWAWDFETALPGGLRCAFRPRPDLRTAGGARVAVSPTYEVSTGGPSVLHTHPPEGAESIDEEQVFLLGLDAPVREATVLEHARCEVDGIGERVGVRIVTGEQRRMILDARRDFLDRYARIVLEQGGRPPVTLGTIRERGTARARFLDARERETSPLLLLACRQRLPNDAAVRLVWGRGIEAASGMAGSQDQVIAWKTRAEFRARFTCPRVNKDAQCIPVLPMTLEFTSPVDRQAALAIRLRDAKSGRTWQPAIPGETPARREDLAGSIEFRGPFPERASLAIEVPAGLRDEASRPLANASLFPLAVRTDEAPPLAKFAARFGIVELKAGAMLPVTVRNVEAPLQGRAGGPTAMPGTALRVDPGSVAEIVGWLRRLRTLEETVTEYDEKLNRDVVRYQAGSKSIFEGHTGANFALPRPDGPTQFEVIGIPLKRPGFHVVELASPRLGAALLGEPKPYYVQSAALVTNLGVHFKLGRESSLVWVTALDTGRPVAGAAVAVHDCTGRTHWTGTSDANGVAAIPRALPARDTLPGCLASHHRQYFVTAATRDDAAFALSDWNDGIAPWRFDLPGGSWNGPYVASAVFSRTLLRAGETVHMKLHYRRQSGRGFDTVPREALAERIVIRHPASDQAYEVPVRWDARGTAEAQWTIPPGARLGSYEVQTIDRLGEPREREPAEGRAQRPQQRVAGTFRVEAFRVPTLRAVVKPPRDPVVGAGPVSLDVQLNYLAGGPAANAPVRLRTLVQEKSLSFPDHEGYAFGNGPVKEGIAIERPGRWRFRDYTLDDPDSDAEPVEREPGRTASTQAFTLDARGAARPVLAGLPRAEVPQEVVAELEYRDPNGETLTSATRLPLWPSRVVVGLKPDAWAASKDAVRFQAAVVDLQGKPLAGVAVKVDLLSRTQFSHRKRLIGGFYAYENFTEVKRAGDGCEGRTDARGLLHCAIRPPFSGNFVLRARAADAEGRASWANQEVWVAGSDEWWFDQRDGDRMDVLPERKRYEPGETAVFQVRMPFREAHALVAVEREGVLESFVVPLSGKSPVVRVPVKGHHAPNVFVSVLAVRGRVTDVQPTALVDLGKPAFRLGIAEVRVGWKAHELKVSVIPDRPVYKVRDKARVRIRVATADGTALAPGAEVALAAVDEGLLELLPNDSWKLLDAMMRRRGLEVETSTAQMHVVGKRHFGRKAVATGGGGGRQAARELFDTLLSWQARVVLDARGEALVEVPLNDALTAFRIVAVADAGASRFGTGQASIRSTQDVMLLAGLPREVREGDRFEAGVTVRNASDRALDLSVQARVAATEAGGAARPLPGLPAMRAALKPGEATEVRWPLAVPAGAESLQWQVEARDASAPQATDTLRVSQRVRPAVPVRTLQATIARLDGGLEVPIGIPADAVPGRGGVRIVFRNRLAGELTSLREYMTRYPYTCLEQRVSQAVALRDRARWDAVMAGLPAQLDRDGLARYFPPMRDGSDTLTAYVLAIADEAGWPIPEDARARMVKGLEGFVTGKVVRHSELATADVAIRKIAALEALSRYQAKLAPALLQSVPIEPNLWPTSAVIDWLSLLTRAQSLPARGPRIEEAEQILRSRLDLHGTTMGFSTERTDVLWWLMVSGDVNANRALLALVDRPAWREDMPRLARGAVGRQNRGRWNTTVANAWGVLAMEKFSERFEKEPVTGASAAVLGDARQAFDWQKSPAGGHLDVPWRATAARLGIAHEGTGKPWVTIESRAAVPLRAPLAAGFRVARTVTAVEQKTAGTWSTGDVLRVRLDVEARSDMTWVVVDDPVPAGASILGTGLRTDSVIGTRGERREGWVYPAFEERAADGFRAYYRFVPQGSFRVEYTLRLNTAGRFELPGTRVEAMYAPDMFAELPAATLEVKR